MALRPLVPSERELEDAGSAPPRLIESPVIQEQEQTLMARTVEGLQDLKIDRITDGRTKVPLIVLAIFSLVTSWDDTALGILLPEMRADFGFDLQFLTTLASVLGIVSLLLAPVIGFAADRIKRVYLIRIGALVANVSSIITATAAGVPTLVLGRASAGVGGALSLPAGFPLLCDTYPSQSRGRIFSFLFLAGGVGGVIGPLVAGSLGEAFGWRIAVLALGVFATVISFGAFAIKEPPRGMQDRLEMGADAESAAQEQAPVGWSEAWRAARSITTVRRLWYATPFLEVAGNAILVFLGLYYSEVFGAGPQTRGLILSLGAVVQVFALLVAGPVADRILSRRPGRVMTIMGLMLVVQTLVVIGLAFSPTLWFSVVITLPLTFAGALFAPALFSLLSLTVPARIRGLGLQTIAPWRLAGLLILPVVGAFADATDVRKGMLVFAPLYLIAAYILGTAAFGVDRDIRAARAASLADQETRKARELGMPKMLVCRDVDVSYDGVQVLFGVDLDVAEGEVLALLGTNGAGKSTLLRAISGIQEASNGAIFLDGQDITHVPPHQNAADGIVMVPGGRGIFPTMTVEENLRAAAWLRRSDVEYVKQKNDEVLGFFPQLRERLTDLAGNLSGGEQQMLALGQAFLTQPRLLMIDELSLGLAPAIVEQLLGIVQAIHERGTTIVLVEQSVNVALLLATRAVFMEKGEVRFSGPTEELLHRPDIMRSVFLGRTSTAPAARVDRVTELGQQVLMAEDLYVNFGRVTAINGAGVYVNSNEIVGVIGPNGAGKTTLFDVLSGFVSPDSGRVFMDANDVTSASPDRRARMGMARSFQNARLFASMTVRENIAVALERHIESRNPLLAAIWFPKLRRAEAKVRRRVEELIGLLALQAYGDKFVAELSTGTRRVVDIACMMAAHPSVLLLDEPSSGLSQAETEELGGVLKRLVKDTGCGMLVIEHDMPLISSISDRLVAMQLGSVIVEGTPNEVLDDPRVIESYLGTSEKVIARSGIKA